MSGDAVRVRSVDTLTTIYYDNCSSCGTCLEGNKERNIQIADIQLELLRFWRNRQLPGPLLHGRQLLILSIVLSMWALVDQVK